MEKIPCELVSMMLDHLPVNSVNIFGMTNFYFNKIVNRYLKKTQYSLLNMLNEADKLGRSIHIHTKQSNIRRDVVLFSYKLKNVVLIVPYGSRREYARDFEKLGLTTNYDHHLKKCDVFFHNSASNADDDLCLPNVLNAKINIMGLAYFWWSPNITKTAKLNAKYIIADCVENNQRISNTKPKLIHISKQIFNDTLFHYTKKVKKNFSVIKFENIFGYLKGHKQVLIVTNKNIYNSLLPISSREYRRQRSKDPGIYFCTPKYFRRVNNLLHINAIMIDFRYQKLAKPARKMSHFIPIYLVKW